MLVLSLKILFILSFMIAYCNADPLLDLRDFVVKHSKWNYLNRMIECDECSSFWISMILFLIYDMIPIFIIFGFIFYPIYITLKKIYIKIENKYL